MARAIVHEAAIAHGLEDDAAWDLMLATSEAMTNAIVHGKACRRGILLRVLPATDSLDVEVCDCGRFEADVPPADPESIHGRGMPIIAAVVDHFEVVPDPRKTRVRFGKRRALAAA